MPTLTKGDLDQIRKVVREEVETESSNMKRDLTSQFAIMKHSIASDITFLSSRTKDIEIAIKSYEKGYNSLGKVVSGLISGVSVLGKKVALLEKQISKLGLKIDKHFNLLDKDFSPRIKRIKDRLDLSPINTKN